MAFYTPLLKLNLHSYPVKSNSQGKLLDPQFAALKPLQELFTQNPAGSTGIGLISVCAIKRCLQENLYTIPFGQKYTAPHC